MDQEIVHSTSFRSNIGRHFNYLFRMEIMTDYLGVKKSRCVSYNLEAGSIKGKVDIYENNIANITLSKEFTADQIILTVDNFSSLFSQLATIQELKLK